MENKVNDLKPLYSRKKSFAFQKKFKKVLLHWRVNLADQNNNRRKMSVTYHTCPLSMTQTFDRHMSILFDQPSQSGAAFAGKRRFSKSRGLCESVSFLPLPLLPLSFFGSRFISRAVKTVPRSFFAPRLNGNACYAG